MYKDDDAEDSSSDYDDGEDNVKYMYCIRMMMLRIVLVMMIMERIMFIYVLYKDDDAEDSSSDDDDGEDNVYICIRMMMLS